MSQFLFLDTERIRLSLFPQQLGHGRGVNRRAQEGVTRLVLLFRVGQVLCKREPRAIGADTVAHGKV